MDHVSPKFTIVTQTIKAAAAITVRMDINTAAALAANARDADESNRIDPSMIKYTSFIFDAKQTSNQQYWIRQLINGLMNPRQYQIGGNLNVLLNSPRYNNDNGNGNGNGNGNTSCGKNYQISNPKCALINPANNDELIIFGSNHFYDIFKYNTNKGILTQYYRFDENYKYKEKRRRSSLKQRQKSIHNRDSHGGGSLGSAGGHGGRSSVGSSGGSSVGSYNSFNSLNSFANYTDVSGMMSAINGNNSGVGGNSKNIYGLDASYFGFVKYRWIGQSLTFKNYLICICDTIFNLESIYAVYNCAKNSWQSVKYGVLNTETIGKSPMFKLIQIDNQDYLFSMSNCFFLHIFRLDKRSQLPLSSIDRKNKKRHNLTIKIQFHFDLKQNIQPADLFAKLKTLKPFAIIKTPNQYNQNNEHNKNNQNNENKHKNENNIFTKHVKNNNKSVNFSVCVTYDRRIFRSKKSNGKNKSNKHSGRHKRERDSDLIVDFNELRENDGIPFPFSQFWKLKVVLGKDPKSHKASVWLYDNLNIGLTSLIESRMYATPNETEGGARAGGGSVGYESDPNHYEEKYSEFHSKYKQKNVININNNSLNNNNNNSIGNGNRNNQILTLSNLKTQLRYCYLKDSMFINNRYWLFFGRFYNHSEKGTIFYFDFKYNEWNLWNTMYDLEFRKFLIFKQDNNNNSNNNSNYTNNMQLCLFPRYQHVGTEFVRTIRLSKIIDNFGENCIWQFERIVWIGFHKNKKNNNCFFRLLSKPSIVNILSFLFGHVLQSNDNDDQIRN